MHLLFILHLRTKQNKMYDIDSKNFNFRGMKLMLLLEKLHAVLKTAWACHAQCPGFMYPCLYGILLGSTMLNPPTTILWYLFVFVIYTLL